MKLEDYEDRNEENLAAILVLPLLLVIRDLTIDLMIVEMIDLPADLNSQIVSFSQKFKCEQLYPPKKV